MISLCQDNGKTGILNRVENIRQFPPRSQVELGNVPAREVALRAPPSKYNFEDKCVPKCNLGTTGKEPPGRRPLLSAVAMPPLSCGNAASARAPGAWPRRGKAVIWPHALKVRSRPSLLCGLCWCSSRHDKDLDSLRAQTMPPSNRDTALPHAPDHDARRSGGCSSAAPTNSSRR